METPQPAALSTGNENTGGETPPLAQRQKNKGVNLRYIRVTSKCIFTKNKISPMLGYRSPPLDRIQRCNIDEDPYRYDQQRIRHSSEKRTQHVLSLARGRANRKIRRRRKPFNNRVRSTPRSSHNGKRRRDDVQQNKLHSVFNRTIPSIAPLLIILYTLLLQKQAKKKKHTNTRLRYQLARASIQQAQHNKKTKIIIPPGGAGWCA